MYNFIKKRFIKDYENSKSPEVRYKYGAVAGFIGIISNLTLFALKITIGLLSGSISIIADAINNLSDAGSSVMTILGFKLSQRPADAQHPFGHARYEYITGFIVAFVVLAIGIVLAKSSVEKIINPVPIDTSVWAIVVLAAAILIKLWQGGMYRNFGKAIDSTALSATAADSRNDVITTSAVLMSTVITMIWPGIQTDGYIGAAVSLFIIFSSIKLLKDTIDPLLGTVPDPDLVKNVYQTVLAHKDILGVHDLMIYNYGPAKCFATLHAEVDANSDILVSHDMIDNIERELNEKLNIFAVIHMDPIITDDEGANELKQRIIDILKDRISCEATVHDFRLVRGVTHTNVLFDVVLPFGIKTDTKEICEILTGSLKEDKINYYFIIHIDNSYL